MPYLLLLTFISIYTTGWLAEVMGVIPRQLTWFPDMASLLVLGYLLIQFRRQKSWDFLYLLLLLLGLSLIPLLRGETSLIIYLSGLRNYFKFLPFFFLPQVLPIQEYRQFRLYFIYVVIIITLIQIPVAVWQRFITFEGAQTGDVIGGTLGANASGYLSQFMFFTISFFVALYFTRKISLPKLALFSLILLLPTLLNETKVTLILLVMLGTMLILVRTGIRWEKKVAIAGVALFSIILFNNVYAILYAGRELPQHLVLEYIRDPETAIYGRWFTKSGTLNRIPQVLFAMASIAADPYHLLWGVGLGNASHSPFAGAIGDYYRRFVEFDIDSSYLGRHIWEWGILGLGGWAIMFGKLFQYSLKHRQNLFSIWFLGVFSVFIVGFVYNINILNDVLGYYFWVLAGITIREDKIETRLAQFAARLATYRTSNRTPG